MSDTSGLEEFTKVSEDKVGKGRDHVINPGLVALGIVVGAILMQVSIALKPPKPGPPPPKVVFECKGEDLYVLRIDEYVRVRLLKPVDGWVTPEGNEVRTSCDWSCDEARPSPDCYRCLDRESRKGLLRNAAKDLSDGQ